MSKAVASTKVIPLSGDSFVNKHMLLVKRIAYQVFNHLPKLIQIEDLFQAGMIGLLEANKNYDSERGASFTTYASIRIRGAMLDEARKNNWLPRSVYRNARMVADAVKNVENRNGHDARDPEIAEEMGVSLLEYRHISRDIHLGHLYSFEDLNLNEADLNINSDSPLLNMQREDTYKQLLHAITNLPEQEHLVLSCCYNNDLKLKEIGKVLGITESRVCQIRSQAIIKIQSKMPPNVED